MNVYICEDSLEGIFTGVYDGWADLAEQRRSVQPDAVSRHAQPPRDMRQKSASGGRGHADVRLVTSVEEYELFCNYITVEPSGEKAWKVSRTVCRVLGHETYECLFRAVCSCDPEKADAVYHTIAQGISMKYGKTVMNHLADPYVGKVFELNRKVYNEVGHWMQFLRFKELANGVLYAEIRPENRVLSIIAPHFSDRLVNENFVIHDYGRKESIVHERQKNWVLVTGEEIDQDYRERYSTTEEFYQELFKDFCHTISIRERENIRLQRQMLPLKFQKYMTEFERY